jgi:hypothetical protein
MAYKIKKMDKFSEKKMYKNDCPNNKFVPTNLPAVPRIIVIGDIHGDYELAVKSFKLAKLIDNNLEWIANPLNTIVVQVGDQIDSCRPTIDNNCKDEREDDDSGDDMRIIDFFYDMHEKASKYGGSVYSLIGNHELMNSQGDFRYVSYDNYHNFSYFDKISGNKYIGPKGREELFKPSGIVANKMACNRFAVLIIGSNMFIHAGVLPALTDDIDMNISDTDKIKYINLIVRRWLLGKISKGELLDKNKIIDNINLSPFWTRIFGSIPTGSDMKSNQCSDYVKKAMDVYKIGKIIVGHTPQFSINNIGINGTCYENGEQALYRVDGGFSKAFKKFGNTDAIQVLEILNDKDFNIITSST